MRTLAIGDIHGCHVALTCLLEQVQPHPEDRIVFLGDYIDRGPASREVVDTLLSLKKVCSTIFLRGNHEEMLLDARKNAGEARLWQLSGGFETVASYGAVEDSDGLSCIPATHWSFLYSLPDISKQKVTSSCMRPWTQKLTWTNRRTSCCFGTAWNVFGPTSQANALFAVIRPNTLAKSSIWDSGSALTPRLSLVAGSPVSMSLRATGGRRTKNVKPATDG